MYIYDILNIIVVSIVIVIIDCLFPADQWCDVMVTTIDLFFLSFHRQAVFSSPTLDKTLFFLHFCFSQGSVRVKNLTPSKIDLLS